MHKIRSSGLFNSFWAAAPVHVAPAVYPPQLTLSVSVGQYCMQVHVSQRCLRLCLGCCVHSCVRRDPASLLLVQNFLSFVLHPVGPRALFLQGWSRSRLCGLNRGGCFPVWLPVLDCLVVRPCVCGPAVCLRPWQQPALPAAALAAAPAGPSTQKAFDCNQREGDWATLGCHGCSELCDGGIGSRQWLASSPVLDCSTLTLSCL